MIPHLAPYQKRYFPIIIKRLLFTPVSITSLIGTEDACLGLNASRPIAKGDLKWRDALLVAHRVNSNIKRRLEFRISYPFHLFTSFTIAPISVVIADLVPVTPSEETQYTNPDASFAIIRIRLPADDTLLTCHLLIPNRSEVLPRLPLLSPDRSYIHHR